MDRRIVLAGLAATVASPAVTLASGAAPGMQPSQAGGAASGAGAPAGRLSQADIQHMQQTMALGMVALETSRLALDKARNEDLKQFAQFETDEQTTLAEVLRSMMDPGATAATGAAPSGPSSAAAPTQLDATSRQLVQKLSQATGAEFDREYLQGQMQGHRDLLQVQDRYLQSSPQHREHANVAKMARGMIREHIALLEDIQKKMR